MTFFPVYCINLQHRKDRREHTKTQFKKLNIPIDKVIYPNLKKDIRGGVYGCFDSHMKIWKHFFEKYPKQKICLIFEDDFIVKENTKNIIKEALHFLKINYDNVDILFLHNLNIIVQNKLNNNTFSNGHGLGTHAYFVTRHFIESIVSKYGSIPKANGRHIDFELNINNIDEDNWLYTEKMFFTKKECVKQIIDKSDNYLNFIDELMRSDVNKQLEFYKKIGTFFKKNKILNDNQLKKILYNLNQILF